MPDKYITSILLASLPYVLMIIRLVSSFPAFCLKFRCVDKLQVRKQSDVLGGVEPSAQRFSACSVNSVLRRLPARMTGYRDAIFVLNFALNRAFSRRSR